MFKRMKYVFAALATALAGLCCTSCTSDLASDDFAGANGQVFLSMSVKMPSFADQTRAGEPLTAEQIRDLRIVVVSLPVDSSGRTLQESAVVEANTTVGVSFNREGISEHLFGNIIPDREKKIYFIANCEKRNSPYLELRTPQGTPLDLNDDSIYLPAAGGPAPIDNCIFTAPTGRYGQTYTATQGTIADYHIPVTAVHSITMPPIADLKKVAEATPYGLIYKVRDPLYLVRAVNKIDLTLENNTGTVEQTGDHPIAPADVQLRSVTISKIGEGTTYLFAHLDTDDRLFDNFRPTADELAKPFYERSDFNPAWMRWLANEAALTQDDNYRYYEWLKSYELPAATAHRDWIFDFDGNWTSSTRAADRTLPTTWTAPTFYFPESKFTDDKGEQQYKLRFEFDMRRPDPDDQSQMKIESCTFEAVMPNLESLFRNTHVKVRFSVTDNADVRLILTVLPWTNAPDEAWHYTHTVTIAQDGFIHWDEQSRYSDDKVNCRLVVTPENSVFATGHFTILSPENDEWWAYLIPITGNPDAFCFVDEQGNEIANPHGLIDGTQADIRIKHRYQSVPEQNTAKLQIMVRTADNRYMEADVCEGPATYYTIIQNRNIF